MRHPASRFLCPRSSVVARSLRISLLPLVLLFAAAAAAQAPPGYYDTVDATSSAALRQSLHEVIDDHIWFPYTSSSTDTWDIVNLADEDPNNPGNILDLYKNASYAKIPGGVGAYNREHSWPNSYGFPVLQDFNYPYTDVHHLFAADAAYNSARSNKPYRTCNAGCEEWTTDVNDGRGGGSGVYPGHSNWTLGDFTQGTWETWDGRKGDVARAMFYMDLRYEGGFHGVTGHAEPDLILTDDEALIDSARTGSNEPVAYMGMLTVLLQWHQQDPPDARELARNDVVFGFQGNRNPFIDHPEWVACLFENLCGPPDATPPAAPAGLAATPGAGFVDLDWSPNTEPDLAGYNVYRSTVTGGPYTRINGTLVTSNAVRDLTVTGGTTYFYVVTAVDLSANESTASTETQATPQAGSGGGVILSEVFYDPSGTDDGWEWVELVNTGSTAVDLSGWCLANGGTDYAYSQVSLSGTVQPGATFVVGGPASGATNANPILDLAVDFNPDFQNSGTSGDGVALFDVPCSQVSASVPVDAVIYGPNNANALIDETGTANPPEVGDAPSDSSLERVDLAGGWMIQSAPNPNASPLAGGPSNTAPAVTVTAPTSGSVVTEGASIAFAGTATDAEDGDLTALLSWTSDLDGPIGSGGSFAATLSAGTHTVTASVTDSGGLSGSDSVTVTVNPAGGNPVTVTFTSLGGEDGWVMESSENSGTGGTSRSNGGGSRALRLGDDRRDRQIKLFVSFDTSAIPAGATIQSATLRLRRGQLIGDDPFLDHGAARLDIARGGFGFSTALDGSDFEAPATAAGVGVLSRPAADGDWSETALDAAGLAALDTAGTTQLRAAFDLDDDDDRGNDYMGYFSGADGDPANHPQLVVTYLP